MCPTVNPTGYDPVNPQQPGWSPHQHTPPAHACRPDAASARYQAPADAGTWELASAHFSQMTSLCLPQLQQRRLKTVRLTPQLQQHSHGCLSTHVGRVVDPCSQPTCHLAQGRTLGHTSCQPPGCSPPALRPLLLRNPACSCHTSIMMTRARWHTRIGRSAASACTHVRR